MTSAAIALTEALTGVGSDTVFGLPGGGPNLDVIDAARTAGLRFVLAHGETAAAIMAATYGLLTGRPAMALATRGPGATSAANGAAQATLDRSPLVLVTDCVPERDRTRVAHQRLDQHQLFAPITKWSGHIGDGPGAAATATAAVRLAGAAPFGAVHLDFDPSAEPGSMPPNPLATTATAISSDVIAQCRQSTRPVVIVGLGARHHAAAIRAAIERLGCPVLTTYQAGGLLPDGHPQLAGMFTNGVVERNVLDHADLVIAIGFDTVEPMPAPWLYPMPVIEVTDTEPVAEFFSAESRIVGRIDTAAAALAELVRSSWPADAGAEALRVLRRSFVTAANAAFGPLELVATVAQTAPSDAIVTVDAGAHFLAVMPFWPAGRVNQVLISNGLATMGYAVPAAIGAALALPGTPVVCFVGDGGLGMTLAELETIVRCHLPITVVVFNDAALTLIELKQRGEPGGDAVKYSPIDFAAVAAAMGMDGTVATTTVELERALNRGWDRPRLIDARIDPFPYRELIRLTRG